MNLMLKELSSKLKDAVEKISRLGVVDREDIEAAIKDMQRALLSADVDVSLVFSLSEQIRKKAFGEIPAGLSRKEHVIKSVYDELVKILSERKSEIELKPKKILLCGLFGSGKTSTAAKLARFYQKHGMKPFLICCDTVRPAAFEQLQQLAFKIDVSFYGEKGEDDSSKVLKNALKKAHGDVIIVDSSGRNALEDDMIKEIKKLNSILNSDEKILVIPSDIGQAARQQAEAFHKALGITDVIVTKLDATAKGGGALTACYETGSKVKFIAVGETTEDLNVYDPEKFVARLLGFPDLESLLEKAKENLDEKKAEKIIKGEFDIEDFYSQIEGMQKMGPMTGILDSMGLGRLTKKADFSKQEEKMKKWKYIIQSMAKKEKANPEIINSSRVRRIAKGSGCNESEVRELISNYSKAKKMMKNISPGKLKRGGFSHLFRQMGI